MKTTQVLALLAEAINTLFEGLSMWTMGCLMILVVVPVSVSTLLLRRSEADYYADYD